MKKTINKGGRPDKTNAIIQSKVEDIRKYCRFGLTDDQIRQLINVPKTSYYRHQQNNKDLWDSLKNEKLEADSHIIASLFKRATGFEYKEVKKEGVQKDGKLEIKSVTEIKKYYPPDTTAIIYWLRNRQRWVDKIDNTLQDEPETPPDFDNMTNQELDDWISNNKN